MCPWGLQTERITGCAQCHALGMPTPWAVLKTNMLKGGDLVDERVTVPTWVSSGQLQSIAEKPGVAETIN